MVQCEEARPLLDAYLDGELAGPSGRCSVIISRTAPSAARKRRRWSACATRFAVRLPMYRAPQALRSNVRSAVRREAAATRPAAMRASGWLAYAASILLAVAVGSGGTFLLTGQRQENAIGDELIDSHLRSLLADHLTDVASSDKHTVKPWFAGRTEVSPPGVDLAAQGFPLVGGRLDLIQGRPVPALVYRAGKHIINVFVLPARPNELSEAVTRRGYTLRHWSGGDLGYWAVSDASPDEFSKFEQAFRKATGG